MSVSGVVEYFGLPFLLFFVSYCLLSLFKLFGGNANNSLMSVRPPVYGPWYFPRFIRGFMAMARLGTDEDAFLHSIRQQYGPVVYLPWPLCQIFVLDGDIIQRVYALPTTTLSFAPIRVSLQSQVFGTSEQITGSQVLERRFFPAHSKGLANVRLDAPIQRFIQIAEMKVAELGDKVDGAGGTLEMGLVRWVVDTMFEAALSALFGEEFKARALDNGLQVPFKSFDACFPLLLSEMVPPFLSAFVPSVATGVDGRNVLVKALAEWVEDGMPGLEEGLVREMAEIGLSEGFSLTEIGTILVGDLWALQANAPFAAASLLLYVLQSPLLPCVREEIDALPTKSASSTPSLSLKTLTSMPLVMSCIQETIRLATSSYSIRIAEKSFTLPTSASEKGATNHGFLIPGGSRIICATRAAHLSDEIWGTDPSVWDGGRFVGNDGEGNEARTKKTQAMRGFGGGVSIVSCATCCLLPPLSYVGCHEPSAKADTLRLPSSSLS
jgi:hypothetical protein